MKKILFSSILTLVVFSVFGQQDSTIGLWVTPQSYKQIKNQGITDRPFIVTFGTQQSGENKNGCNWQRFGLKLIPYKVVPKIIGGEQDTFIYLPTIWNLFPDTVLLKLMQPKPKEEEQKIGLHIFAEQVVARDFGPDHHQINNPFWLTTRAGIENSPWSKWNFRLWGGFYPRRDFKSSFNLPVVSATPSPDEGWCDCKLVKGDPEFSIGLSVSRKIPLVKVLKGGFGLNPMLSTNLPVSKKPVPDAKWALPGSVVLSLPIEWQTKLYDPEKKETGTTASVGIAPGWQFNTAAHNGFGIEFFAKLSLGTKWFAPKAKKPPVTYDNPRLLEPKK